MPVELYEISGNRIIFRNAAGAPLLDTADRMPARLGSIQKTVTAKWDKVPGEKWEGRFLSGGATEYRYIIPAAEITKNIDLGAAPVGYVPNFAVARIRSSARAESTDVYGGFVYVVDALTPGRWQQLAGSVYAEQVRTSNYEYPIAHRHMNLNIAGGRWVLQLVHSSRAFASNWGRSISGSLSTAATRTIEISADFGVVDL